MMWFPYINKISLFNFEMTLVSSYNYATLKLDGYVAMCRSFIMLRLMVAYGGLLEIWNHYLVFKTNKLGLEK